jgi:hypothetical protein
VADHTFAGLSCSAVADLAPAFVLGALDPAESGAVRRHLAECPEAHPEMAELNSVVPALFEVADPVAAPAGLKERILAAAAADTQRAAVDTQRAAGTQVSADVQRDVPRRAVVEQRAPGWTSLFRRPIWAAASLALALAVVAVGAWNLDLQARNDALARYQTAVQSVLQAAARPGTQVALLAPQEGAGPSGIAAWAEDGSVAMVMRDLAPTTGTQVYEAWLIAGQSAPIPIGGFRVGADGTGTFQGNHVPLGEGVLVALTLEGAEGATTPTLPIVALGEAKSQQS